MSCQSAKYKTEVKPIVSFIFDDGWENHFKVVKPIFDERNIKCGFAIVKRLVGVNNRLDSVQIKQLNDDGFEILSHSVNHFKMSSNELDVNDAKKEIVQSLYYLRELNCKVNGWVTPMSIMHDDFVPLLGNYEYGFTKSNGLNPIDIEAKKPYKMTRVGLESITLQKAKWLADIAYQKKKPVVFYTHSIDENSKKEEELILLIDYCIEKGYAIGVPNEIFLRYY
ncbi:polysaccharide deacetylase family protein [Hyunsoonleella rubra]|uniref:Polysaccharide deacetylase family protein n=1 Tax=Hyunsoonleella rubra TaxID=1737062 RepID=A0ABW5T7K3_9FLAO